jgi:diacylglycerol O-acyltransferase / wax synthase
VAIVSYDGGLNFGVTGDYETAPDINVLCEGIEAGIAELLALSQPPPAKARTRRPKRPAARPTG